MIIFETVLLCVYIKVVLFELQLLSEATLKKLFRLFMYKKIAIGLHFLIFKNTRNKDK